MIGQRVLLATLEKRIKEHNFPRFCILTGSEGSGKKTLANEIENFFMNEYGSVYTCWLKDVKVATVRDMINNAYRTVSTTIYVIPDADSMSIVAKNALLKVTEEPPNNAYFIMTLLDKENTLATIRSRGTVFNMSPYSKEELDLFCDNKYYFPNVSDADIQSALAICDTPGEVLEVCKYSVSEFIKYVQLVLDYVGEVSLPNSLKIGDKVALKTNESGYDLKLFWKMFQHLAIKAGLTNDGRYLRLANRTSGYIQDLKVKGINKQMLFDVWVLDMREIWM